MVLVVVAVVIVGAVVAVLPVPATYQPQYPSRKWYHRISAGGTRRGVRVAESRCAWQCLILLLLLVLPGVLLLVIEQTVRQRGRLTCEVDFESVEESRLEVDFKVACR